MFSIYPVLASASVKALIPWTRRIRVRDVKEPEDLLESIVRHEDPKKWNVSSPGCLPIGFYMSGT